MSDTMVSDKIKPLAITSDFVNLLIYCTQNFISAQKNPIN